MVASPGYRLHWRPTGLVGGPEAVLLVERGEALPLAGGPIAFTAVERLAWDGSMVSSRKLRPLADLPADMAAALARRRPAPFDRPRIMGILNVTPDSFSDGGADADTAAAVTRGLAMAADGADIVDVGGESTRPGAAEVPAEVELARVLPVVERLAGAGVTVSIDTRKAEVMRAAIEAGAGMVNDVSGLTHDPEAPAAAAEAARAGARVVLMHMRGVPATMNKAPDYRSAILEVCEELARRIEAAVAAGVPRERIVLDPGLCFAKHEPHNLEILRELALLHGLGPPVLVGVSRKGWAAWLHRGHAPADRLPASLAAAQWALDRGATLLRVHDVAATRQMVRAWRTLAESPEN
ncbi:MAG TPA: dihydropteroate synthase [Geminicoccaceae bacterium]|nr:dihydropteroate synthase [Geminicoccus sp.]HMU52152.1 dihydropteroate synthase [Geminicoccaceae bacterium]